MSIGVEPFAGSGDGDQVSEAVALLYQAVLRGRLRPGEVTTQVRLAKMLAVGRTPLREALRIAQSDALLEFGQRRITIAQLSPLDLEELYLTRIMLEALALRFTLPALVSADFAELEALIAQMRHFWQEGELDAMEEANKRFHGYLLHGAQPRTLRLLRQLDMHAERYRREFYALAPSGMEIAQREHRAIVDAAKAGNVQVAIELLVAHYVRTAGVVMAALEPGFDDFRLREAVRIATAEPLAPGGALGSSGVSQGRGFPPPGDRQAAAYEPD